MVQIGMLSRGNLSPKNVSSLGGCVGFSWPVYVRTTALFFVTPTVSTDY